MAESMGFTTGRQVKLYHKSTLTATPSYANLVGTGKLVVAGNEVKETRDIGDIEQNANNIEFGVYGEDTQKKVAGQASLGDFTFTFALQNNDDKHEALVDSDIGDNIEIAIQTMTGATQITLDYITGTVGGVTKSTPIDETAQVTVTVAMSQKPQRFNQA